MPARNSYIRCVNGRESVQTCPNGYEYDPFERRCLITTTSSAGNRAGGRQNPCFGRSDGVSH